MHFTKMQGCGNDYVYVDCFAQKPPANPAALSVKIADRHFGVGGDGLILICSSDFLRTSVKINFTVSTLHALDLEIRTREW